MDQLIRTLGIGTLNSVHVEAKPDVYQLCIDKKHEKFEVTAKVMRMLSWLDLLAFLMCLTETR